MRFAVLAAFCALFVSAVGSHAPAGVYESIVLCAFVLQRSDSCGFWPFLQTGCQFNSTFGCINGYLFDHETQYVCGTEQQGGAQGIYYIGKSGFVGW